MATSTARRSLVSLLPDPPGEHWGVALHYEGGNSDKDYRIVATGNRTVFQYGKAGSSGEIIVKSHADAAAATAAARKQWASKEGRTTRDGYWPVTGLLALDADQAASAADGRYGGRVVQLLAQTCRNRLHELAVGKRGRHLWLCQSTEWGSPGEARMSLSRLAEGGAQVGFGEFFLASADDATGALLTQICPVAIRVGERTDGDEVAVAEAAAALADGLAAEHRTAREALAAALEVARAVMV